MKMKVKKFALKNILFFITFLSFLLIVLFFISFAAYVPGSYQWDASMDAEPLSVLDIVFAFLLLINEIGMILSLYIGLKTFYYLIGKKETVSMKQFGNIFLGLYPVIIVVFCCSGRPSMFLQYLIAPIRILFRF